MTDRFAIPTGSGRSMALGDADPRRRRDAAARVPENVPAAEAIQRLEEPPAGADAATLRDAVTRVIRALKERG